VVLLNAQSVAIQSTEAAFPTYRLLYRLPEFLLMASAKSCAAFYALALKIFVALQSPRTLYALSPLDGFILLIFFFVWIY
jgi:hypothetical protein